MESVIFIFATRRTHLGMRTQNIQHNARSTSRQADDKYRFVVEHQLFHMHWDQFLCIATVTLS